MKQTNKINMCLTQLMSFMKEMRQKLKSQDGAHVRDGKPPAMDIFRIQVLFGLYVSATV